MPRFHRLKALPLPAVRDRGGGFTLIEIVITIVLFGVLAALGSTMISDSATVANITNLNQTGLSQSRYAVERLAREIREVRLVGSAYDIGVKTGSSLTFTKSDGVVVAISHSGTTLSVGYTPGPVSSSTLTNDATVFALSYLDINGTPTAVNANIRFVQISLTTHNAAAGVTSEQRTRVALRNIPDV